MASSDLDDRALALGRIPSGLFVVTTLRDERAVGFVGSFVMQMGFAPPTVAIAVGKERGYLADLRRTGRFTLSILDKSSMRVMKPFMKPPSEGSSPFDGLALAETSVGVPALSDSLAWIACRIAGEYSTPDHIVVFGEVVDGKLVREGDPSVHLRKNGLGY